MGLIFTVVVVISNSSDNIALTKLSKLQATGHTRPSVCFIAYFATLYLRERHIICSYFNSLVLEWFKIKVEHKEERHILNSIIQYTTWI